MRPVRLAVVVSALVLGVAACADGGDDAAAPPSTSSPPAAEVPVGSASGTAAEILCQGLITELRAMSSRVSNAPDPAVGRRTITMLRARVDELQALDPPARDGARVEAALDAWHVYIDSQEAGIGQPGLRVDEEDVLVGIEEAHVVLEAQGAVTCATFLPVRAA